jgi:Xaa-Pro aminopeptidase
MSVEQSPVEPMQLEAELERATRLSGALAGREIDVLLITTPVNVRYLTGFTGSSGLALVAGADVPARPRESGEVPGGDDASQLTFFTDFRYRSQSAEQLPAAFAREIVAGGDLLEAAAGALAGSGQGRLGFESTNLTYSQHARLSELAGPGWELVPCPDAVERLRAVKDESEVDRIRAAAALADRALTEVLEAGIVGRTEREIANELELRMRRLGATAASFPSIVAAGAHGALPHAEPREEPIPRDVLVTIDWGAELDGYCSDCTRTYATGEHVSQGALEVHRLVLDAEQAGVAAVRAGLNGKELDAVAREVIEAAGQGENFGHGLGHGVGMEIHEAPRLARTAGEQPLVEGNVVTIEPGVYLPGSCGVRIEDLMVVRPDGGEILTSLSRELTVVS